MAEYDHEINMYCKDMWRKLDSFDNFIYPETHREVTAEVRRSKRAFDFSRDRTQSFQLSQIKVAYDFLWLKRNSESLVDPPRRILPHPGQPPEPRRGDLWRDDTSDESDLEADQVNGDGENVSEVETPTRSVNNSSIQVKTED